MFIVRRRRVDVASVRGLAKTWGASLRPHQWVKNLLVFLPLLMAHRWFDIVAWWSAAFAFFAFSLCASAVYLFNDVMDIEADRSHPRKAARPIAQGLIQPRRALVVATLIMLIAVTSSAVVLPQFAAVLVGYALSTFLYSAWLKRWFLLDCVVLGGLYTVRITAGSSATGIETSPWLLTFAIALFFSLALVKRYAELRSLQLSKSDDAGASVGFELPGRRYAISDIDLVARLGVSSGFVALMTLALYVRSDTALQLYSAPHWLLGAVVAAAVWFVWIWSRAREGRMGDDPVLFAFTDRFSLLTGLFVLIFFMLAATT